MPITGIKISPSVRRNIYGTRTNPSNSIWNNANEIWGSWTLEGEWDGDIDAGLTFGGIYIRDFIYLYPSTSSPNIGITGCTSGTGQCWT